MDKAIQLGQSWSLGPQLGKGGFGRVLQAKNEDGDLAAVKLIPKEPGADRELLFEDLSGVSNVIPIIDRGEWKEHWVLVMPMAEKSLRSHLIESGPLSTEEVVSILIDLTQALEDLSSSVVHRDIKPDNVLYYNGRWCLSDFGISRYLEATTAAHTRKWAWSRPYNPPERWRGERVSPASDIYSLGVMAYEMLTGYLPFGGPDFRNQHLNNEASPLENCPSALAILVASCLLKAPAVRPTAGKLRERLQSISNQKSPGAAQLQAADHEQVQRMSKETALQSAARSEEERRREMFSSATKALGMTAERFREAIVENATTAEWVGKISKGSVRFSVKLGPAMLSLTSVIKSNEDSWGGRKPEFEVIAHTEISIEIPPDRFGYEGRSHSLWFCDAQEKGAFHWYETAFMASPLIPRSGRQNPFALPPSKEAGGALSRAMAEFQVAWPFMPVEVGLEDEFIERWINWFGLAAQGRLSSPSSMPERSAEGSWRS